MGKLLDTHLAALPVGAAADWSTVPPAPKLHGRRVALVDKADRSQVQLVFGHPSVAADDPDYYALQIATTAFGGGMFTSRLMQEVRVKRGWSYGASARLGMERVAGMYTLQAAPAQSYADETLDLMLKEYAKFVREGLTDDEVEFARGYLINSFAFSIETPAQRVGQLVRAKLLGRPDDYVDTYVKRIQALKADEIRDAVRRRLDPDNVVVVMVCTAPPLRDKIAAVEGIGEVTLHPYNEE
jgi:zinc protease